MILAIVVTGCQRTTSLDTAAQIRLQQLQACDCLNHDGFPTIQAYCGGYWCGEVLANQNGPITFPEAVTLWLNSPEHREILLDNNFNEWGYAQSDHPTPSGWWIAVMEVRRVD